ncbi:hypothetical protein RSAG8_13060, partial [Rhizoctonia solani AG-8 WAC10335]
MYGAKILKEAKEKAKKAKRGIRYYLPGGNTKQRQLSQRLYKKHMSNQPGCFYNMPSMTVPA